MSLAERIAELDEPTVNRCKFGATIDRLREIDDDTDEFVALVEAGTVNPRKAAAILQAEQHPVSETVVRKHARGDCCCT